ncbi:MAG: signal peptide peptidase SppA [Tepidisphaeraceae bacterium]
MTRRSIRVLCLALIAFVSSFARPATVVAAPATQPAAGKGTIAVFALTDFLRESPGEEGLPIFEPPGVTLRELTSRMRKAADDANVKAVVLTSEGGMLGIAQTDEVRQAMKTIRDAGKDVYVNADSMRMGQFALYSGASRLSVVPTGDLMIYGFELETPFLRGMLDKLGVQPQFLTCGAYKSAAEIFMRTGPSKEADEMFNWLVDGLYDSIVHQIADGRKVDTAKVKQWIDGGLYTAETAKEAGLIDAVEHRQDFEAMLRQKYGADVAFNRKYGAKVTPQVDLSNPFMFFKVIAEAMGGGPKKIASANNVAVVYVDGMIVPGKAQPSIFGGSGAFSSDIRKALNEAAEDDSVKGVVLRVDSQGGSAVASEIIRDATLRVKAKKPIVVSMGNIAGSGGYYVSSGVDTIFADEGTITGSIGVVSGKLVTTPMWQKVGITFKGYRRGALAGVLSSSTPFTDAERDALQGWMDSVYVVFKKHVTDTRGDRLKKPIDDLAGGRVYTGKQALEFGLIDKIGSLNDAVLHVAEAAKLGKDYDVRVIPEPKNFLQKLMEEGGAGQQDTSHVMAGSSFVDLARPFLNQLDPGRVQSVERALRALDLVQQESVILWMPEATR